MPGLLSRTLAASAVTGAVLALAAVPAAAVSATAASRASDRPVCTAASSAHRALARRLGRRITAALKGRAGTESVAVYDRRRGVRCAVRADRHYDSASVVKATILAALLWRTAGEHRALTASEDALATRMITRSDNGAASALWRSIGSVRFARFLKRAGMTHTTLDPTGHWGLTRITAADQITLLRHLTGRNTVLTARARAYELGLMHRVIASQRWGTTAGTPAGITWHVKNGWLPRHGKDWRVHSIGAFTGRGRDYLIVVLTEGTPTMAYGVGTIERVARAVHGDLAPGTRVAIRGGLPRGAAETSDGSVPRQA
ncbi:serine hydrolase [Actinomadura verrucosospora]|uniref:Secreted protein n=1 Tax=Actinomadura verrucosospora TaxID=46165 RepID=A0A7D4A2I5_ACTVE|nr:serine hydrolase [Actinomadura verrucosospora]QKG23844.1 secreted protein [Actinomadura verrucosospora]